jgi:zinc/manganese transport system ATP-binding protein
MKTSPLIIDTLTVCYKQNVALQKINYQFDQNSLTAIIGPNGGGKSTLLKAIMGVVKPCVGKVIVSNNATKSIAYLPQLAEIDRNFPISVYDVVSMGLWQKTGPFGRYSREFKKSVKAALQKVGLQGYDKRMIGELSGGQCQRVLFARTILQDASIILLDEPFTGVDHKTTEDLMAIIKGWHEELRTVLVVIHDYELVKKYFNNVVLIAREIIANGTPQAVLNSDVLLKAHLILEGKGASL